MRVYILYVISFWLLSTLGRQLSPQIASLDTIEWLLPLAIALGGTLLIRRIFQPVYVDTALPIKQFKRQYMMEWGLFLTAGSFVAIYISFFFHFDANSIWMIFLEFAVVGFFVSADLSLERERKLIQSTVASHDFFSSSQKVFPLTRQFIFMATGCSILAVFVLYFILIQDIPWILNESQKNMDTVRSQIFIEVTAFVFVLFSFLIIIMFSYLQNIKVFLKYQKSALHAVRQGNLSTAVPVSRLDEFGALAVTTNSMIETLRRRTKEMERTQDITVVTLASLAETRDIETSGHIWRTQHYVKAMAEHLQRQSKYADFLSKKTIEQLFKSAALHDIGKVGVTDRILLKPGPLTFDEFEEMKQHTLYGRDAIARAEEYIPGSSFLRFAKEIAYVHHERFDGTGYPQGLKGTEIPLSGRIMAVADVFDAVMSRRVYKPAFPFIEAKKVIEDGRGELFDPDVVDAFLAVKDRIRQIAFEFADSDYDRNLLLKDEMDENSGGTS